MKEIILTEPNYTDDGGSMHIVIKHDDDYEDCHAFFEGSEIASGSLEEVLDELLTQAVNTFIGLSRYNEIKTSLQEIVDASNSPSAEGGDCWFSAAVVTPIEKAEKLLKEIKEGTEE